MIPPPLLARPPVSVFASARSTGSVLVCREGRESPIVTAAELQHLIAITGKVLVTGHSLAAALEAVKDQQLRAHQGSRAAC
jgi:hypothetical protein